MEMIEVNDFSVFSDYFIFEDYIFAKNFGYDDAEPAKIYKATQDIYYYYSRIDTPRKLLDFSIRYGIPANYVSLKDINGPQTAYHRYMHQEFEKMYTEGEIDFDEMMERSNNINPILLTNYPWSHKWGHIPTILKDTYLLRSCFLVLRNSFDEKNVASIMDYYEKNFTAMDFFTDEISAEEDKADYDTMEMLSFVINHKMIDAPIRISVETGKKRTNNASPITTKRIFNHLNAAIWYKFFESVILKKKKIKQCPWCGNSHTGQGKYCPKDQYYERSSCENSERQQRHRDKNKAK